MTKQTLHYSYTINDITDALLDLYNTVELPKNSHLASEFFFYATGSDVQAKMA
jgi:site-specific DNA-adenine methylase